MRSIAEVVKVSVQDLITQYSAERHKAYHDWEWHQTSLRLPAFLFERLDAIAEYTHQSRQRLVAQLLDEASFELAFGLVHANSGTPDKELEGWLLGDLDVPPEAREMDTSTAPE